MGSSFDQLKSLSNKSSSSSTSSSTSSSSKQNSSPIETSQTATRRAVSYPPAQQGRIKTGIKGFDSLIGGGFRPQSVNLISGGPGTGKTIMAMEFIINGIKLFNEPGVYLSFDERKDEMYANMKALGWDLQVYEDQGMFHYVEYNPSQLQHMLNEGGGLLDNLMTTSKAKRFVIDSISTFLLLSGTEFNKREQLSNFFKIIRKWGVTSVLTNEYTPITGNEISKETLSVEFETDSIIQLYYIHDSIGTERKRLIEIYKMRATNHLTRAIPYAITQSGIYIK